MLQQRTYQNATVEYIAPSARGHGSRGPEPELQVQLQTRIRAGRATPHALLLRDAVFASAGGGAGGSAARPVGGGLDRCGGVFLGAVLLAGQVLEYSVVWWLSLLYVPWPWLFTVTERGKTHSKALLVLLYNGVRQVPAPKCLR